MTFRWKKHTIMLKTYLCLVCLCVSVTQSCPTLSALTDCSLPGSSVLGVLQSRILEWIAIPFSRRSSWSRDWTQVSYIAGRFFTVWAIREELSHVEQFISQRNASFGWVCKKHNLNYLLGLKFWLLLPSPLYFNVKKTHRLQWFFVLLLKLSLNKTFCLGFRYTELEGSWFTQNKFA